MKRCLYRVLSHVIAGNLLPSIVLNLVLLNNAIAIDLMPFTDNYSWDSKIKSVKTFRVEKLNHQLVRQRYDFSCAAASLATLLNYQYGEHYLEVGIRNALRRQVEPQYRFLIEQKGFSAFEITEVSNKLGYKTDSFNFDTLQELQAYNFPSIVKILVKKMPHFVVVTKIAKGRVFLADPALGNRSMSYDEFTKVWQHFALFILPKDKKIGDKTLVSAFEQPALITNHALYTEQTSPNVWLQQDIDKFIVTTTPFALSK